MLALFPAVREARGAGAYPSCLGPNTHSVTPLMSQWSPARPPEKDKQPVTQQNSQSTTRACLWTVGRSLSTWVEPMQTQRTYREDPVPRWSDPQPSELSLRIPYHRCQHAHMIMV